MNIIDLLYCKYVWGNTKIIKSKRATELNRSKAESIFQLSMLPILFGIDSYMCVLFNMKLGYISIPLYILFLLWIHLYFKNAVKRKRIVYNLKYMQSRWGVFWAIMMPILCFGSIVFCSYICF